MIHRRQVVWNPLNIALIYLTFSSIVPPAIIFSRLPVSFTRSPLKRMLRMFYETLVFHPLMVFKFIRRILAFLPVIQCHPQVLTSLRGHIWFCTLWQHGCSFRRRAQKMHLNNHGWSILGIARPLHAEYSCRDDERESYLFLKRQQIQFSSSTKPHQVPNSTFILAI